MNNYLLQLLKEVKTIIIPGLGAITLTNEATGEIMFMNYLKYDDGTLTKHIAEKEGWSENDAKNLIAKFVREVMAELDKGNSYDMYQFGSFKKVDGEIVFEQWREGTAPTEPIAATTIPDPVIITSEAPVQPGAKEEEKVDPIEEAKAEETVEKIQPEEIVAPVAEIELPKEDISDVPANLTAEGFETTEKTVETTSFHNSEPELPKEPINDIPEEVKIHPGDLVSPKMIVEAEDEAAIPEAPEMALESKIGTAPKEFTAEQKKKNVKVKPAVEQMKPDKKKKRPLFYILWGIIVLILGGATYVAFNFEAMKKQYPLLADMAGESHINKRKPNIDSIAEANGLQEQPAPETLAAPVEVPESDPLVDEAQPIQPITTPQPEIAASAPEPTPQPAPKPVSKPKPVAVPKPAATSTPKPRPAITIGKPDPAKPYHVIAGSFSSRANAERLAQKLKNSGNNSTIVGEFNGMYRVSIASFATKDQALSANSNYQSSVPGAWVFKWP